MYAYIFVDNSNLWIEGKYAVASTLHIGQFESERIRCLPTLRIDYGRLLTTVLRGRQVGADPVMVGSRPPPNDSLWELVRSLGYDVRVFDRVANREKKVDTELTCCMMEAIFRSNKPGILILVAGDGDYSP
ncbi:hypothetical protein HK102_008524, partial [Quaeritorhiza haematococci]